MTLDFIKNINQFMELTGALVVQQKKSLAASFIYVYRKLV